ncbi:MAG TPA: T9SS type A sorting domain-containing protein, partial [Flavisolibacter sp.]
TQFIYLASELTAAGLTAGNISSIALNVVSKLSVRPFQNLQIKMGQTGNGYLHNGSFNNVGTTLVKSLSSYATVAGLNTFVLDASFSWNGTSHLVVEICYDNGSASAGDAADVLGSYSDGTANYQMLWQNNITCSSSFSSISAYPGGLKPQAVIQLAGTGNSVETTLNATTTSYLSTNDNIYFYNSGKIVARVQNSTGFNYGCTQVIVDRAGSGANSFWGASNSTYLARKTYRIIPTTNNATGTYQITLYYTAAEKTAWEAATGHSWNNIKIVKVKSQISNYTPATPAPDGANAVEIVTPVLGTYGADYTLTGTFTTGFSGFGVGIPGSNTLPMTLLDFKGQLDKNTALLNWSTSSEQASRDFDVEKSTDGSNYYRIGTVTAAGNSSTRKEYSLRDDKLSAANYYRLRMNDMNSRSKLSEVVLLKYNTAGQNVWVVNNPFKNYIDVRLAKDAAKVRLQLVNAAGSIVEEKSFENVTALIHWQLSNDVGTGTYILRTIVDGTALSSKLIKQ